MVRLVIVLLIVFSPFWGCISLDKYSALREAYDKVADENQTTKKELAKASSELKRAQQDVAAVKGTSEELSQQVKDLEAGLQRATQEKTALAAQLEATKAALASKEDEMGKTVRSMEAALKEEIAKGSGSVRRGENSLNVELAERILYDSGSADIKPDGTKVLKRIAEALKGGVEKDIRVEGHTDDVPIRAEPPPRFFSNWELSTARAVGVVRYLEEHAGVNPARLSAAGFGPTRPAVPNENDEARARNRRVEIIVTPARSLQGSPPN